MLGYVYGKSKSLRKTTIPLHIDSGFSHQTDQRLNSTQELGIKVAAPVGNVFGQIVFGWLADKLGRKRMCKSLLKTPFNMENTSMCFQDGVELIIMFTATFAQAISGVEASSASWARPLLGGLL
jgi:MFS family permease